MLKRIMLLVGCVLLLVIAWVAVFSMESTLQKQEMLIALADAELERGIYASAEPYLVQAAAYNTKQTFGVLERLKEVYLALGSAWDYLTVLKQQTARSDCTAEAYSEFARYYIEQNKIPDALDILKLGIEQTQDEALVNLYEKERYAYTLSKDMYEDVTAYQNGGIQVKMGDQWGLANSAGKLIIPCSYEQISAYDTANNGCMIAMQTDKKVVALNAKNQMIARLDMSVRQIGYFSQDMVSLQLANGKWVLANGKLAAWDTEYEGIGAAAHSAVAIQSTGKWGVKSLKGDEILPCEYDEIIMDELGRCYAQEAVFAKKKGIVYLFVNKEQQSKTYEDACPFNDDGWAAVKKNGAWGFIDTSGELKIDYQFEEALSFSGQFAAVKKGSSWGYINQNGKIVIQPKFIQAKSFAGSNAPVLTELGWQFISLLEYSKGASL